MIAAAGTPKLRRGGDATYDLNAFADLPLATAAARRSY